jgi:hypothetical protein
MWLRHSPLAIFADAYSRALFEDAIPVSDIFFSEEVETFKPAYASPQDSSWSTLTWGRSYVSLKVQGIGYQGGG